MNSAQVLLSKYCFGWALEGVRECTPPAAFVLRSKKVRGLTNLSICSLLCSDANGWVSFINKHNKYKFDYSLPKPSPKIH